MLSLLKLHYFYLILFIFISLTVISSNKIKADQNISIYSDEILISQEDETINAVGNSIAIDQNGGKVRAETIQYNKSESLLTANDNVIVNDLEGNTFFMEDLKSNNDFNNLEGNSVKARMKDGSRIVGSRIRKEDNISVLTDAEYTPCKESEYLIKNCPGWKLKSNKIYHDTKTKTIHYDHARLHLFNLPIFYMPYFAHPDPSVKKRSGLLMPTLQTDKKLGDTFSLPIFYNIASNQDLTLTPTIQSKSNNFYSINYRLLNNIGNFNLDASIDDNNDNAGTRNHLFLDSNLNSSVGELNAYVKTSNNDTYMRKNKINKLTILNSGIDFKIDNKDTFFSVEALGYKHLTIEDSEQWEYVYPRIIYNIDNLDQNFLSSNLSMNNEFLIKRDLNESYTSLISSQINLRNNIVQRNSGLVFGNEGNFRIVSVSEDNKNSDDINNVRFYPQINSKISYPLIKTYEKGSQTLTPMIMPIIAPYNNYTNFKEINNSNIFSSNRATSITEWESGPRINYGIDWFIDSLKGPNFKFSAGQSYRFNKRNSDNHEEISDYFVSSNFNIDNKNYINSSFIIDREDIDMKNININSYTSIKNLKFAMDYDYTSGKYSSINEQFGIGAEYNFKKNFFLRFTGTKDIDTNKNIGYQYGILYENDCLGIDLNYYRDLTKDRDIVESEGYSFTIVLKPFGSTRSYGKNKVFGPEI